MDPSSENEMTLAEVESHNYELLAQHGMNRGAAAATLSYLGDARVLRVFDKWKEISCPDNSKALVLKNPGDAFQLYAKEWTGKFSVVIDILKQLEVSADAEVKNKIVRLYDNLNYVNAALQEMYKNSYLTFAATPCNPSAQEEKRRMDNILAVIGLSLISVKLVLDNSDGANLDRVNQEVLKLIDRVVTMLDTSNRR